MSFSRVCLVAFLVAFTFAFGVMPSRAASPDDAVSRFTADDFDETSKAISEVAASGDPRAETILVQKVRELAQKAGRKVPD